MRAPTQLAPPGQTPAIPTNKHDVRIAKFRAIARVATTGLLVAGGVVIAVIALVSGSPIVLDLWP